MSGSDAVEKLRSLAARIEDGILREEHRLQREIDAHPGWWRDDMTPDDMLDSNGRPILLDARVALANAWTAIANAERGEGGSRTDPLALGPR